jgi:hypothetical protein
MISLKKILFEASFTIVEQEKIADAVETCFMEKGIDGVTDYDVLQMYLDELPFYVAQNRIKIGPFKRVDITNELQAADIFLDKIKIGTLNDINKTTLKGSGY